MSRRLGALSAALLAWMCAGALAFAGAAEGPAWSLKDLRRIVAELDAAGRHPDVRAKDEQLALAAARAYGEVPRPGDDVAKLSVRTLTGRVPTHPEVEAGQELLALMRQLYADISERAGRLGRLTRDRKDRAWLEETATGAGQAADTLASEIRVKLAGIQDAVELPPKAPGDAPTGIGAKAEVVQGRIIVERLPRATFVGDRPPADLARTRGGALREVRAALKQFDTTAQMLGQYDPEWKKKRGHLQVIIPARAPAIYLNEIWRAAGEVSMRWIHLLTLDGGELKEIPLRVSASKRAKATAVSCPDDQVMSQCALRLAHARAEGATLVYAP